VTQDPSRLEHVESVRRYGQIDGEDFDRIGFAIWALGVLAPPGMTVACYPAQLEFRVTRGRDWAHGPDKSWAMVGIPRRASRRHIALALAELAGVEQMPFVLDLLASPGARATPAD
jgi:hypothetical protein